MESVAAMVSRGLEILGMGVGVVFVVLGVFYGVIRLLQRIWPSNE